MQSIGIGMIGCGGMANFVGKLLLDTDPRIEVRAICDPDEQALNRTRATIAPNAKTYTTARKLAAAPEVDWVMIASWNCFHREQTVAALRAGKHVFCQKPLATNFKDCLAMHRAWRESGKTFSIGLTLRYSAHYRRIKQLIDEGRIGRIISMEFNETLAFTHGSYIMGNWRRLQKNAGTHLLEKCCHDIDLVNWMVGSRASRVASFGGLDFFTPENEYHVARIGKSAAGHAAYGTWPPNPDFNAFTIDKDIIDNQVAVIEFANGVRATFHANCNAGIQERRMYILGSEGAIRADVLTGTIELQRIGFDTTRENLGTDGKGGHGGGDEVLARELAASMLDGAPPAVGMEEGLASSIVCFAIDKAMETGRVVDVRPYWDKAGLSFA